MKKNIINILTTITIIILSTTKLLAIEIKNEEYFVYKGIATKKSNAMIVYTKTFIDNNGYWNIEETFIKGFIDKNKIKDPFLLKENNLIKKRKTYSISKIDLKNKRTVYNKTISYYDFGNIENTFDIRNKVQYTNKENTFAVFSFDAITQIIRMIEIEKINTTNRLQIIMPTSSPDNKIKFFIENNGIKKINIQNQDKYVYELELKIENMPFSFILPKINAYVDTNKNNRKIIKYNSITGVLENMDIYLTEYKNNK